jgi:predicted metal-binding protein
MNSFFEAFALTKSGELSYEIELCAVSPRDIEVFVEKSKCDSLCITGCKNYNRKWSCPPFSPSFKDFSDGWERLFVLYMRMDTEQFSYVKNDYLKIKAANSILKSRADKFLRIMAAQHGKSISTGSCRLCKPCKCSIDIPCARPEIMAYSFESLGVDVSALVNTFSTKPLLWYKPHNLPEYTAVVCGLLTNDLLSPKILHEEYLKYITQ